MLTLISCTLHCVLVVRKVYVVSQGFVIILKGKEGALGINMYLNFKFRRLLYFVEVVFDTVAPRGFKRMCLIRYNDVEGKSKGEELKDQC
jgi:hypothetical protein